MQVLVINSGSSSVKFEVFATTPGLSLLRGEVGRVGEADALLRVEESADGAYRGPATQPGEERRVTAADHHGALGLVLGALKAASPPVDVGALGAVGHRVVHGGERFTGPVVIDDAVLAGVRDLALLAPLHAKANAAGIEAARAWFPDIAHVAVFDTSFHRTMPPRAREYALPRELSRRNGIRRYGFHGTSHGYVAKRAAVLLGRPLEDIDLITLHLGNGASVAAIKGGRSIDTSMGMTPLEGLVMGTRCGDVDPAVPMLIGEITGRSREDVHRLLNFESGLAGICGASDMREVHRLAAAGDTDASLALDMYCYRAKKYVGAYFAALGGADAIVFTAGVGENDADVRSRICGGLEGLGIELEPDANERAAGECVISTPRARVKVLVVPTDEETEIARAAVRCVYGDDAAVSLDVKPKE